MKKRALCPLSGVHLTIKPNLEVNHVVFFHQLSENLLDMNVAQLTFRNSYQCFFPKMFS